MANENEIKRINLDDINYAVYKIGKWENDYKINQVGLSDEIPQTKNTYNHVIFSMEQIRNSEFEIEGNTVNGFVAIAYNTNPKIKEISIDKIINLEEKEFNEITEELNNLEFLNENDSINLDNNDFLIYKLEEECNIRKSIPANDFTLKHHINELKKIENL